MPFAPEIDDAQALEYLRAFLDILPHDVVFWRLEDFDDLESFRVLFTAHDVLKTAGFDLSPFLGKRMGEVFPNVPTQTDVLEHYRNALRTGEPWEQPAIRYADERTPDRDYRLIAYPVTHNLIGLVAEDVTDKVEAERARNRAMTALDAKARELERSNQELEAFAYVASHDLKSPLRDIENLATWIHEDAAEHLPDKSRRHLQRLRDRVSRMQRLLDALLEYSRAGRVVETLAEVDVLEVLRNARELVAAPEGFRIALPESAPVLTTTRAPLEQVFLNLLVNAVKHHESPAGRVEVSWRDAGEHIEFAVSDDGPGIPERFQERIFRLFTTLRPRDEVEGSGMGLALVKKLVEFGGGTITVESEEGQGSTFRFTWPKSWPQSSGAL